MTSLSFWLVVFLIVQLVHFLGTWKLYQKAGRKSWEAAIPIYNAYVLTKIINRHWFWVVLLFIPVVNLIACIAFWLETARSFGKTKSLDLWLSVLTLGFYSYYLNYVEDVKYIPNRDIKPKSLTQEIISSTLFAVTVATLIHTYVLQPFNIPTGSLERTLLIGDFLFVSKFHYGARNPMTAISFPMLHDTIPLLRAKSYNSKVQYPYFRLPGSQKVKRNEIVVFNWPVDTVKQFFDRSKEYHYKPIDKKSNYVKRCVGLPGDHLSVKDGYVYINGKQNQLPDRADLQFSYIGVHKGQKFSKYNLYNRYHVNPVQYIPNSLGFYADGITDANASRFKNHPNITELNRNIQPKDQMDTRVFGASQKHNRLWNRDHLGEIYIPKKGENLAITSKNIQLYQRLIEVYEGSELGVTQQVTVKQNQVFLNNQPLINYTFKQDYYWMMGDNRHNSEDSRMWGFVPENHIVGKPVFIWLSLDRWKSGFSKIRFDRIFTTVHGSGERKSYFIHFIVLVILYSLGKRVYLSKK